MTTKWAGWIVAALALAALAGSVAWAATTGTTEVRINARQLEDGRVEFALTQDGGERILPSGRYFPADAEVGRWLRSTPIELSVEVESNEAADDPANDPTTASQPPGSTTSNANTNCPDSFSPNGAICAGSHTVDGMVATSYVNLPPGRYIVGAWGRPRYSECSLWPESVDGDGLTQLKVGQWDGSDYIGERRTYISVGTSYSDDLEPGLVVVDSIGCANWIVMFQPR